MTALFAILMLIGFVFYVGCFVEHIAKAKCFSHLNRNVLLQRAAERWKAVGP